MHSIDALKCVYDTKTRKWAIEILYSEGEKSYRFDISGPQEAQTVIEAFNMAVISIFDPASGEIHFISEPQGDDPYADEAEADDEEENNKSDATKPRRQ
ncbi:MAG: hypothetical protein HZY79_04280 [Rhodoblastus sp.]|nr:MAG: hypothetical protein HZY79_04280 [Rhodoblastus sp.]